MEVTRLADRLRHVLDAPRPERSADTDLTASGVLSDAELDAWYREGGCAVEAFGPDVEDELALEGWNNDPPLSAHISLSTERGREYRGPLQNDLSNLPPALSRALLYWSKRYHRTLGEDAKSVAYEALVLADQTYAPGPRAFTGYATEKIRWALSNEHRSRSRDAVPTVALDTIFNVPFR